MKEIYKKMIAEAIGTAVLVFVACGVAVVTGASTVATSLAFGLVIVAMAYSIGNISGCHINPAVTFGMAIAKKISWKEAGLYIVAQVVGAFVGALLLGLCLRGNFDSLGGNEIQNLLLNTDISNDEEALKYYMENGKFMADAWSYIGAFLVEVLLTFVFVLAIFGVTDSKYHDGKHAGIVIGLVLTLVHLLGLAFTGTSVNPARSLAPAVIQAIAGNSTSLQQIWIWILAPLAGGALAALVYTKLIAKKDEAEPVENEEVAEPTTEEN